MAGPVVFPMLSPFALAPFLPFVVLPLAPLPLVPPAAIPPFVLERMLDLQKIQTIEELVRYQK
jgi:hypothetical protein